MPRNISAPTHLPQYRRILCDFMSYRDGRRAREDFYPVDHDFPVEQLSQITPEEIYQWMAYKLYHMEDPGPDDRPLYGRASSLLYYKKSLSWFMPNKNMVWNELTRTGNPTKSNDINDLIRAVTKQQVRRQGAASQADRPMEVGEFRQLVDILHSFADDQKRKYVYSAAFKFQVHLLARIDDTAHVLKDSIKLCPQFHGDCALITRLRWSKNVSEERDAPEQVIIGAMDPVFCVILALAIMLELMIASGEGCHGNFLFCMGGSTPNNVKATMQRVIREDVVDSPAFVREHQDGKLGSHSIRKFGATYARRSGCSKDDVDYRGRWKGHRRQSDQYTDPTLNWPDVKVATKVCIGGPCKYAVQERSGANLSSGWLAENVTPHITGQYGPQVGAFLGRALLWAVFEDEDHRGTDHVPLSIRQRVVAAYRNSFPPRPANWNPIRKVQLVAWGEEAEIHLEEIPPGDTAGPESSQVGGLQQGIRDQMNAFFGRFGALERKMDDYENQSRSRDMGMQQQYQSLNQNVRRLASRPIARRRQEGTQEDTGTVGGGVGPTEAATLSRCPRDLYVLWSEFEDGIGGRKPARLFTARERGRVKFQYSRRKVVWDAVDRMVRSGATAQVACDRIYTVHGRNQSVTQLIACLRRDGPGGHPNLR